MLRRILLITSSAVIILAFASPAFSQDDKGEYEVKAAFLLNFVRFAEWPASTFADSDQPIVIAILGDDPFDPKVLDGLAKKTVNGRTLSIRHLKSVGELGVCNVLFVGRLKDKDVESLLVAIKGRAILTVGDGPRFLKAGGMIQFCLIDDKIRFEVNLEQVEASSIKLSAKLLGVAQIVRIKP
jgi:hypothetical protein